MISINNYYTITVNHYIYIYAKIISIIYILKIDHKLITFLHSPLSPHFRCETKWNWKKHLQLHRMFPIFYISQPESLSPSLSLFVAPNVFSSSSSVHLPGYLAVGHAGGRVASNEVTAVNLKPSPLHQSPLQPAHVATKLNMAIWRKTAWESSAHVSTVQNYIEE